jgi:hypothetical protein
MFPDIPIVQHAFVEWPSAIQPVYEPKPFEALDIHQRRLEGFVDNDFTFDATALETHPERPFLRMPPLKTKGFWPMKSRKTGSPD